MPKSLSSIDDHTSDVLEARRKTKGARFKPLPAGVERVEEVLRNAIAYLHEHLKSQGFKAAPSQLSLFRKFGEITQVVRLRAGSSNLSGVSAEVSAETLVKSASLKRWTQVEGTKYPREVLWIRQLGYLSGNKEYYKWQLVDTLTRERELADVLLKIQTLALPAFDAWANKPAIASAVFRGTEVERIDWLVEAALWSGNYASAAKLGRKYLEAHPHEVPIYAAELARFKGDKSIVEPKHHPVSGLAFLVARHALESGCDG